jgi:hypothetical protein
MANSRASLAKRQEEQSQTEKQREKVARKKQRGLDGKFQITGGTADAADVGRPSEGQN